MAIDKTLIDQLLKDYKRPEDGGIIALDIPKISVIIFTTSPWGMFWHACFGQPGLHKTPTFSVQVFPYDIEPMPIVLLSA